jgi:hypothetical protein
MRAAATLAYAHSCVKRRLGAFRAQFRDRCADERVKVLPTEPCCAPPNGV